MIVYSHSFLVKFKFMKMSLEEFLFSNFKKSLPEPIFVDTGVLNPATLQKVLTQLEFMGIFS